MIGTAPLVPGSIKGYGFDTRYAPFGRHLYTQKIFLFLLVSILSVLVFPPAEGRCSARRINTAFFPSFYLFDADYFELKNAPGADLALRYEIYNNTFFENRLGIFGRSQNGRTVGGFNGQLGVISYLPFLIPYRPFLRGGMGLLSANPVTSTPSDTYRPSQTQFYLVAGGGVSRPLFGHVMAEVGVYAMLTPYKYMIYSFDRKNIYTGERQFTHFVISLGCSYTF